jgi:hypothetical protein
MRPTIDAHLMIELPSPAVPAAVLDTTASLTRHRRHTCNNILASAERIAQLFDVDDPRKFKHRAVEPESPPPVAPWR